MLAQLRSISGKNACVAVDVITSTRPASCSRRNARTRSPSWLRQVWRSDWKRSWYIVREPLVVRLGLGALDLLLGQLDQLVEVLGVADLEQVVGQHRDQRRRQRHGRAVRDVIGDQPLEHLHQRQVRPGDRLVEPLLLHHRRIFGVTDERQVGVQDEREISGGHGGLAYGLAADAGRGSSGRYVARRRLRSEPRWRRACARSRRRDARWRRRACARSRPPYIALARAREHPLGRAAEAELARAAAAGARWRRGSGTRCRPGTPRSLAPPKSSSLAPSSHSSLAPGRAARWRPSRRARWRPSASTRSCPARTRRRTSPPLDAALDRRSAAGTPRSRARAARRARRYRESPPATARTSRGCGRLPMRTATSPLS